MLNEMEPNAEVVPVEAAMNNLKNIAIDLLLEYDPRYFSYTPKGINDWFIAIGFEKTQYDQMSSNEWK